MAKKQAKQRPTAPAKASRRGAQFRGGRKAEGLSRIIDRLKSKFPMEADTAGEWLHYARVMRTTAEVLEVQALNTLDPARLKGLKEAMAGRAKAKSAARGSAEPENEDDPEEE